MDPDGSVEFIHVQKCIIWGSVDIQGMKSFGIWLEINVFFSVCALILKLIKCCLFLCVVGKPVIRVKRKIIFRLFLT